MHGKMDEQTEETGTNAVIEEIKTSRTGEQAAHLILTKKKLTNKRTSNTYLVGLEKTLSAKRHENKTNKLDEKRV